MEKITREKLSGLLDEYDVSCAHLECDGLSRVLSHKLTKLQIEHTSCFGVLMGTSDSEVMSPHFWLRVGDYLIDYRARCWFGERMPHGVNLFSEFEKFYQCTDGGVWSCLPDAVIDKMIQPIPC